jgi:hypothetical protein
LSTLSTIVALLLGIACVAWLRGPETLPDTTVALLGRGARSELTLAVTGESRRSPAAHVNGEAEVDFGSDLAQMARSLIGRVARF